MLSYISLILAYFMLFISFSFNEAIKNFFDKEIYSLKGAVLLRGKALPSFITGKGIELVEFKTPEKIYEESSYDIKELIEEIGGDIPYLSCAVIRVKDMSILKEIEENDRVVEVIYPYSLRMRLIEYRSAIKKYTFYFPGLSIVIFILFFLFDRKTSIGKKRWMKITLSFLFGFLLFLGLIFYMDSLWLLNFKVFFAVLVFPYLMEGILRR